MREGTWGQALAELVQAIVDGFVRFWKQDIVQVGLALGMFLALAVPLLIVMLLLWYLDSTGWRPASGFYKIGAWTGHALPEAGSPMLQATAVGLQLWLRPARTVAQRAAFGFRPPPADRLNATAD